MSSALVMCQVKSVLGVMLLSMLEGMAIGWASPGLEKMESGEAPFTPVGDDVSWIIALFDIGVMLGSWASTVVFAVAGRRQTVLVGPVTLTLWVILTAIGASTPMLIVARILAGCGMGIALSFSYIYVGEVTTRQHRGPLILAVTLLMPTGQLISYLLGSNVPWLWESVYPVPFIVAMLVCVIFFMQETPFYLAGKDRVEELEKSLRALRVGVPEEAIREEMESIQRAVKQQREDATTWSEMFRPPGAKKAAFIVVVESSALALLGVTNVLAYTQQIFKFADATILSEVWSSVLVILVEIIAIVFAMYMVERVGRRVQLTLAACACGAASFGLAAYFFALRAGNDMTSWKWVPLATLLVYIFGVGGGINTIPQVLMSELLNQRAKTVIAPVCMTIMSLTSFGINKAFLSVGASSGYWVPFLFFTCTNVAIALFTLFVVPETKGKTLVEVQEMLRGKRTPSKEYLA
ncbi:Facilitated trehalose transporter Tret1-2-like protein [Frankliniella fusca]|uniref:Facilitated trehalose transporter Tret1-2-like protein n=1 Tax=Frankliniella fusca TaxID=407009 RepID=A0AAE1HGX4_9NEOP|nr:Facilitated trehalose transporter Tret1-2-like protein [Frankliniella fusca]